MCVCRFTECLVKISGMPYGCQQSLPLFFFLQLSYKLCISLIFTECSVQCVLVLFFFIFHRYCVFYIHEEFCRLLNVLKNSMVADENCLCECEFCSQGFCKCVFKTDMDLYWFMRHVCSLLFSISLQGLFIAFVSLKILVILNFP